MLKQSVVRKRLEDWFNESRIVSWVLTPVRIKFAWRGVQRARFCNKCHVLTKDAHWTNNDTRITYGHRWLCEMCFYTPMFSKHRFNNKRDLFLERFYDV